jgi:ferredoxin
MKDLKSVNGTYLKVREAVQIQQGDQFRLGQQVFTFSLRDDVALDSGQVKTQSFVLPLPSKTVTEDKEAPPEKAAEGQAVEGPAVTFKNVNKTFPNEPGQTLCELAEANGISIVAECHEGVCGSDPIRIISGEENLNEPGSLECETLEDICELEPGKYRMACVARANGTVVVEILEE